MLAIEELQHRRGQFALIMLIVTMIAYLVVMMGALGAGLLDLAGSAVKNLDADILVFRAKANLSLQQSELTQAAVDSVNSASGVGEKSQYPDLSGDLSDLSSSLAPGSLPLFSQKPHPQSDL